MLHWQCNGKHIVWTHLQNLYHRDSGAQKTVGGLSLVPKLTYEHIYLTSFSKMHVDLAAQVSLYSISCHALHGMVSMHVIYCVVYYQILSSSVANALKLSGDPEVSETAKFVEMFDKLFDCLNVTNYSAGKKARKPFQDSWRP